MADEFGGEIPVGPFALIGGDEIGRGIVATLAGHRSPAVLMRSHGVFTIGPTAARRGQGRGDVRGRRPAPCTSPALHGDPQPLPQDQVDALHQRYQAATTASAGPPRARHRPDDPFRKACTHD